MLYQAVAMLKSATNMSILKKTQRKTSIHVVHCSVQIEINVIWNDEPPSTILF